MSLWNIIQFKHVGHQVVALVPFIKRRSRVLGRLDPQVLTSQVNREGCVRKGICKQQ